MKRAILLVATGLALPLAACTANAGAAGSPPAAAAQAPEAAFAALTDDFIATHTALDPVTATQLGEHSHDSELPDISAEGRDKQKGEWRRLLVQLRAIDRSALPREAQVDYLLLENELEYSLWKLARQQEWAWNPQVYNDIASYALYNLVARDFAPWPDRLRSATERMERLPAFLAEARGQLELKRVPRVHAETVAAQNAGIMEIVDGVLLPEAGQLGGVDRERFDRAVAGLKRAVDEHQQWLDSVLVPNAEGDFRLGAELYDEKMRLAMMTSLTRSELKRRAHEAKDQARAEMFEVSQEVLAARGETVSQAGSAEEIEQRTIEAALEISYARRPDRSYLEQRARETLAQATEFARKQGFVEMPKGEVQVITMPKFWQGNAVAYDDAPPPLDPNQPNFYAVSPIPDSWTDEQATSFLREYNDYMIHDLSIHEGVPGHYLQGDHAARYGSVLRHVLSSSPYAEGWAVYAEGMMADEGYLGENREDQLLFRLTMLKMRLRSITNTLLDIGIQTEAMTRDEALELMMVGAFQQEREAAGKWIRANLSSVQLLSYFTGYVEHMDMRDEAKRRWGDGYSLRRYNDAVLNHGSPPVRFVRQLIFELDVE